MNERANIRIGLLSLVALWWHPVRGGAEAGDPASLAQLHDIVVPAPVSPWWPLAPGWYLLVALGSVAVAWILWRSRQRHRARRYRTEALAELRALRRSAADPREKVTGALGLLKRTALVAYPRTQVAALSGGIWWHFLDQSGGKTRFTGGLGDLAERLVYAQKSAGDISARDLRRLFRAIKQWIKTHRPLEGVPVSQHAGRTASAVGLPQVGA